MIYLQNKQGKWTKSKEPTAIIINPSTFSFEKLCNWGESLKYSVGVYYLINLDIPFTFAQSMNTLAPQRFFATTLLINEFIHAPTTT